MLREIEPNVWVEVDSRTENERIIADLRAQLADAQREIAVRDKALDTTSEMIYYLANHCKHDLSNTTPDKIKAGHLGQAREAVKNGE